MTSVAQAPHSHCCFQAPFNPSIDRTISDLFQAPLHNQQLPEPLAQAARLGQRVKTDAIGRLLLVRSSTSWLTPGWRLATTRAHPRQWQLLTIRHRVVYTTASQTLIGYICAMSHALGRGRRSQIGVVGRGPLVHCSVKKKMGNNILEYLVSLQNLVYFSVPYLLLSFSFSF